MKINLEQDEKIIFIAHRHWFVILGRILGILLLLIAPIIVFVFISTLELSIPRLILGNLIFMSAILLSIWSLILWLLLFIIWTNYFLDMLVVTNKKVIDIEQKSLFSREISSFPLEKIQDITTDIDGIIPTFLNFGDVYLQTAGDDEDRKFMLKGAKNPAFVKGRILKEQQRVLRERSAII